MPRLSGDNPVRRRLFAPDNLTDEAKIDNFANLLQESIITDCKEKSEKWNFDFEKEEALDGDYEWYLRDETSRWVRCRPKVMKTEVKNLDSPLPMKIENEITPRVKETEAQARPLKRKQCIEIVSGSRRKLSFD